MRILVLTVAAILPSIAIADSCVTLEGADVVNSCQTCMEVTTQELKPQKEQDSGLFVGESRSFRLDAGQRETVQSERSAITDLRSCQ